MEKINIEGGEAMQQEEEKGLIPINKKIDLNWE